MNDNKPLFVQNDFTVLLEEGHPDFAYARFWLSQFADLVKSPRHLHTYRISPLSLWNAASTGVPADKIIAFLSDYGKFGLPSSLRAEIEKYMQRYGLLRMNRQDDRLLLESDDAELLHDVMSYRSLQAYICGGVEAEGHIEVKPECRGVFKQELIKLGYPVEDLAGYRDGESLTVRLREQTAGGRPFALREYQRAAVEAFYREGRRDGGSGVIVLPCGAGKTVVGIGAMEKVGNATLILTTNVTSVRQWRREILDKTNLPEEAVGEYSGACKEVRPVTIATYQILTHRRTKDEPFRHMQLFSERDWGLIVYDEVHLLPAPVFRVTAGIQAKRRLGLTATLVREDGCEEDVFSLVGPKRYDMPWKQLEASGHLAEVSCTEIRAGLAPGLRAKYAAAEARHKFRLAAENPAKLALVDKLLERHGPAPTLIIGQYLDQLQTIAERTGAPLISGRMPHEEREALYARFQAGELNRLVVSKVANFAVDLPDAAVAIEVSGSFGSRQEEAQRLGRILRPKSGENRAYFYSVVSEETAEQEFALKRQLFLVEQGYHYEIEQGGEGG